MELFKKISFLMSIISIAALLSSGLTGCGQTEEEIDPNLLTVNIESNSQVKYNAYKDRTDIGKVVINRGVTEIGEGAFSGCTNLRSVTLPDTLKKVDFCAFTNCGRLKRVYFYGDINSWLDIYFENGTYTNPLEQADYFYYEIGGTLKQAEGVITIPDGATEIKQGAFAGLRYVTEFIMPDSVKKIGANAFEYAYVEKINIPKNATIGDHAFKNSCIKQISIGEGVSEIGQGAFMESAVEYVTLPESVTVIQNRLFSSCWQLKKVTIGSKLTKIGEGAFYNCEKLRSIDYGGTAEKWASIPKGSYNYSLENVRINYNAN